MKKPVTDPFENLKLDDEEEQLEAAFAAGEYGRDEKSDAMISMLREAAGRYLELNNAKPVTIRINQLDLIKVKAKAKSKNIPYQTLLGALIRSYADGEFELSL